MATLKVGSGQTYATIQGALDVLFATVSTNTFTETWTIEVYPGTYTEIAAPNATMVPTATYRLILKGIGMPIIDGGAVRGFGIYIKTNYTTVDGFEVINTAVIPNQDCSSTGAGILMYNPCTGGIIQNNICRNNGSDGIYVFTSIQSINNNTIYSNGRIGIFHDNNCNGYYLRSVIHHNICYSNTVDGITIRGASDCDIYDNICYSNVLGIAAAFGGPSSEITKIHIYNNYLYSNTAAGIQVGLTAGSFGKAKIYNNTFKDNLTGVGGYGVGMTIIYNNVFITNTFGCYFADGSDNVVYNNTFNGNSYAIHQKWTGANNTAKNNIIMTTSGTCLDNSNGLTFTSDYNLL